MPFTKLQRSVLAVVLGSYLMLLLDTSIVITGLPSIRAEFGLSAAALAWVSTAYLLGFGGFMLAGARAGDLFGRRRMFLAGLGVFTLASALVGLAPWAWLMIAGRFAQGLGAAVLAPSTLALLQTHFPDGPERTRALSAYAATAGIGSSAGLVLGGVLAGLASWRWGFLVNLPAGLALMVLAARALGESGVQRGRLDIGGAALSTAGMSALVYAITLAGDGGQHGLITAGLFAAGLAAMAIFLVRQARHAAPILPLALFADRQRAAAIGARLMFTAAMMGFFFVTTQIFQTRLGMTPQMAGLAFLPMTAMTLAGSQLVPWLTGRLGLGAVVVLAFGLLTVGLIGLAMGGNGFGYWAGIAGPLLALGLGNGMALGPLTQAGVRGVPADMAGAAAGLVNTVHQLGGALGISLLAACASAFGLTAALVLGAVLCLGGTGVAGAFLLPKRG